LDKCSAIDSRMFEIFDTNDLYFWDKLESEANNVVRALKECDIETLRCYASWFGWLAHTTTLDSFIYFKILSEYEDRTAYRLARFVCNEVFSNINFIDLKNIFENPKIFDLICSEVLETVESILYDELDYEEKLLEGAETAKRIVECLLKASINKKELPDWLLKIINNNKN